MNEGDTVKFVALPSIITSWVEPFIELRGKRVLDFGCGFGVTAAGMATKHQLAVMHGVDINQEADGCVGLIGRELPKSVTFEEILPGQIGSSTGFDLIYSWSVFEHVRRGMLQDTLEQLVEAMNPGGVFFLQISPLYFSPEGSHLWSIGYDNWEHLTKQMDEVQEELEASEQSRDVVHALWSMYRALNRVTPNELLDRLSRAGLEQLRVQIDRKDMAVPRYLLESYNEDALRTFQIVCLFRKPE